MSNYVVYSLHGFNTDYAVDNNQTEWAITLQDNHEHIYPNHPFLYSVFIDDHLQNMIFKMRPNVKCAEHLDEIEMEAEKIFFNIICYSRELLIETASFKLEAIVDEEGQNCNNRLYDRIGFSEKPFVFKQLSANSIYDAAFGNNAVESHMVQYVELSYILQNPHRIIQFIGLYDIMANLIYNSGNNKGKEQTQKMVCKFFKKYNDGRYRGVTVEERDAKNSHGKDIKKDEDTFTYIRNQIAHCKDRGDIKNYLKVATSIQFEQIQTLLTVINDLLCGTVVP